jgi:siroheme decarboxylase
MGHHNKNSTLEKTDTKHTSAPLTTVDLQLLNAYQKEFPLVPRPYAQIAQQLNLEEDAVIQRLERLQKSGIISRIGVVLHTGKAGISTLAAVEVPIKNLQQVADVISGYPEVNHNYEREHTLNLWFVVTAASQERLTEVLTGIETECGVQVHIMPMLENYHIDLGFPIDG